MESGPASPPSQFLFSPRARSQRGNGPPSSRYLRAAPRRGVLPRTRGKTPSGANSPVAPRGAPEAAAAGRLQRGAPRRRRRSAGAPVAGVSAASPWPSRGASPAAYLRGAQAPEPIHMVFSPPSSGAAEAAPVAPRRAREPVGLRERRGGGAWCPRPGGRIPPWRGRRPPGGAARAAALCAPGELSVRWLKRGAPGRKSTRGSEGPLPLLLRPAGGRVSAAFGHDDPSSSPAAAPSPPTPLLTDGATATTRRRRRGCSQLLTLMLRPLQPQPRVRTGRVAR